MSDPRAIRQVNALTCTTPGCGHQFGLSAPDRLFVGPTPVAVIRRKVELICPKCGKVRRWNPSNGRQEKSA